MSHPAAHRLVHLPHGRGSMVHSGSGIMKDRAGLTGAKARDYVGLVVNNVSAYVSKI